MADVLDILTLDEGKSAVRDSLTNSSDDETLAAYITAVSRMFDAEFGPVVVRDVVDTLYLYGGERYVLTTLRPVKSFTTVTEYVVNVAQVLTAETAATPQNYGYWPDRYSRDPSLFAGRLERRGNGYTTYFRWGSVVIAYVAGRFTNTATIDGRWKTAAQIALAKLWEPRRIGVATVAQFDVPASPVPGAALPNAVFELLGDERQHPVGIG